MSRLAVTRADGPIVEDERRDVVLLIPLRDIRYEGLFRHVKLDSIAEVLAPAPSLFSRLGWVLYIRLEKQLYPAHASRPGRASHAG